MPLSSPMKSPHRNGRNRNAAQVRPFMVYRALKAGIAGRDQIARATGVPSNVVSRILNSRNWTPAVEVQELTEELV